MPPEDLDRRLRALFRAQMPHPWPPAPATSSRPAAPPPAAKPRTRWPLLRTRLALAASVALLVTGLLFLAGAFPGRPTSPEAGLPVIGTTANSGNDANQHPTPPTVTFSPDTGSPIKLQVDESLIQGPSGTMLRVDVKDLPPSPK